MERYVVFIRKMETGEEFISAHIAQSNAHEVVIAAAKQKYSEPAYMVHTAYTEKELNNILESLNRWCEKAPISDTIQNNALPN
jgi:bifunctional DNase/RNase